MSHRLIRVTLAGLSVSAFACGGGGASYSGATQPRVTDPIRLGSIERAAAGQERLGRVSAECERVDAREGLDGARLSDVGCSSALLRAALRERGASAGGVVLVGEHCSPDDPSALGGDLECEAEVWGPAKEAASVPVEPLPPNVDPWGPAAPLGAAYGAVGDAWHVLVDFWPAPGQKARAPVAVEAVSEVDFPRVGTVTLGNVRARADVERRRDSVRGALRAAAARAGATSLVGVRCIAAGDEQTCIASVAAPEVNEVNEVNEVAVDQQASSQGGRARPVAGVR